MSRLSAQITIEASADAVWDVIGRHFDRIGEWATAIPASVALESSALAPTAPVAGRVCTTGVPFAGQVTETLVAYDDAARTLTYEATGLPRLVATARNTWTVTALSPGRCRVTIEARFETRGMIGRLARLAMVIQVRLTGGRLAEDLRHYVEHGVPSPRKQRQLGRSCGRGRPARHEVTPAAG